MEITYWLSVNWPWIAVILILIFILASIKNKIVRKKLNSLFGWPPEP